MVGNGSGFHFQLPGKSKQRILHPAKVVGLQDDTYTAEVEEGSLAVECGQDVLVYFEKNREFMQQEIVRIWRELRLTVVFVTHDLDEALTVGSMLAVLGGKPARLMSELIAIELPHPRDVSVRSSEGYFKLRARALALFEQAKKLLLSESGTDAR